jgi:hypothetical protein
MHCRQLIITTTPVPELEIHHESEHAIDPIGQKVGVLAAVVAVVLAIAGIASHRTHTDAIMRKSAANDAWGHLEDGGQGPSAG